MKNRKAFSLVELFIFIIFCVAVAGAVMSGIALFKAVREYLSRPEGVSLTEERVRSIAREEALRVLVEQGLSAKK